MLLMDFLFSKLWSFEWNEKFSMSRRKLRELAFAVRINELIAAILLAKNFQIILPT